MNSGTQGPNSLLGQSVGGYRLISMLGRGATGAVFLGQRREDTPSIIERTQALPVELPDEAAIKVLILPWQLEERERADFHARFIREAQTLQRLRHPAIVPVLDYGDDPAAGVTYMTLRYMAGGTLAARLAGRTGPLPLADIASNLGQVAAALDYAHSQGVVHRDIKPANLLLDDQGQAYISDFSIVRVLVETHSRLTSTGRVMGTPEYMAPEQIDGRDIGPAADIYGLGMVAYALTTGDVAFSATTIVQLIHRIANETPPAPRTLRPDLPEPAEAAILRALAKDPAQRFPTAAAFAAAFAQGLQGQWYPGLTSYIAPDALSTQATPTTDAAAAQTVPNAAYAPTMPAPGAHPSAAQPASAPQRRTLAGPLGVVAALLLIVACVAGAVFAVPGSPLRAMLTAHPPTSGASAQTTSTPSGGQTPTTHATATPKKDSGNTPTATTQIAPAMPTQTPIPLGTIIYQANWSGGMDGWQGNAYWSVQGGNLVNNGTDDNSTHHWPSIVSPYKVTQTNNYAVETRIQMTTQGANAQCFDVGSVRGSRLANGEWQSYIAAYCNPLGLTIGIVNGTTTRKLISTPFSPGYTPHVYRFEVVGSTLSLYADGQLISTVRDTTYASGGGGGLNTYNTGVIVSSYVVIYE